MDNIRDAALAGIPVVQARKGWTALADRARLRGALAAECGSTSMRLTGGYLLLDRTTGFSEDEFYRAHREYEKFGINDFWIISAGAAVSSGFMERHGNRCLRMSHASRNTSHFVIGGTQHSLDGGLDFIMKGATGDSTVIPVHVRRKPRSAAVKPSRSSGKIPVTTAA